MLSLARSLAGSRVARRLHTHAGQAYRFNGNPFERLTLLGGFYAHVDVVSRGITWQRVDRQKHKGKREKTQRRDQTHESTLLIISNGLELSRCERLHSIRDLACGQEHTYSEASVFYPRPLYIGAWPGPGARDAGVS